MRWWSHIRVLINWEEQMGSRTDLVPARGNKAANLLLKTPVGVEAAAGETPSLTREVVGDPQGPRMYTWESAPEGPNLLVSSRGSD